MDNIKQHQIFLFILLSISLALVFFIVNPLLTPLIMAGVFAFLFHPIYEWIKKRLKNKKSITALLVTLLTFIVIIIPIGLIGAKILKEATDLYKQLSGGEGGIFQQAETYFNNLKSSLPFLSGVELNFRQYISQALEALAQNIGSIFSSVATIILNLFVFLVAYYYLLKDGAKFRKYLVNISPLEDRDDEFIVERIKSAVQATVKGSLTIGLIQGILTGIGFAIFGVSNPVLWGSIAAIAALIPGIGTALVFIPTVIYLLVSGDIGNGIGLTIWGLTAVGLVDNFLGPKLIGKNMKLHPLAVFVSVLGGLALFGPLGFIFGPLALSICMAVIDIYSSLKRRSSEKREENND